MSLNKKVFHISSVHKRDDIRIFKKQCISLKNSGFEVVFFVNDMKGDEIIEGIKIFDLGFKYDGRIDRFLNVCKDMYKKLINFDADIYHFHDPELMPLGLKLKSKGKIVIYDVHEDLPRQILTKNYIPKILRHLISFILEKFENYASRRFNMIFTATPYINDRFLKINSNSVNINNYPILSESKTFNSTRNTQKENTICYIGSISKIRGLEYLIKALDYCDVKLILAGSFSDNKFEKELRELKSWKKVNYIGHVSRKKLSEVFSKSKCGIVTFLSAPNHINAQPNKLFEYMSAGLPIVCSNFPLWRKIINQGCGISVDPKNPFQIASAIKQILENPSESKIMSKNGIKLILKKYNWNAEEIKLIKSYKSLK